MLSWRSGQSTVEFAFLLLFSLPPLMLVTTDIARAFYMQAEVENAARAGAQYGSRSPTTAVDTTGISTYAANDAANVSGLTVSSSTCTCPPSGGSLPTGVTACPSSYCTNSPESTYVQVNTSATFTTVVPYPGIPNTYTIQGQAIMQVQQQQ